MYFASKVRKNVLTNGKNSGIITRLARLAGIAQLVEQLICNQQVGGSSPSTSSTAKQLNMGEFPSGQRGQTVNLLAMPSVVRIHLPPPKSRNRICGSGIFVWNRWIRSRAVVNDMPVACQSREGARSAERANPPSPWIIHVSPRPGPPAGGRIHLPRPIRNHVPIVKAGTGVYN